MASSDQVQQRSGSRGFGSMDPERQRAIAAQGGRAAHQQGKAHEFTSEEARIAGAKGGVAAHRKGTAHEFTSEEARAAGRAGGQASRVNRSNNANRSTNSNHRTQRSDGDATAATQS